MGVHIIGRPVGPTYVPGTTEGNSSPNAPIPPPQPAPPLIATNLAALPKKTVPNPALAPHSNLRKVPGTITGVPGFLQYGGTKRFTADG